MTDHIKTMFDRAVSLDAAIGFKDGKMTAISTEQAAIMANTALITVQKWCKKNNIRRFGRDYILSMEELEAFRNRKDGRRRNK